DRVQALQEQGLEQRLGRDARAATIAVRGLERPGHVRQSAIDHPLDRTQRMAGLDQVLDVERVIDCRLTLGLALHTQLFAAPAVADAPTREHFFNGLLVVSHLIRTAASLLLKTLT